MSTIAEVAARFAKLDLMKEAQIAIGKTSKDMIKAQIQQRVEQGIDGKGRKFARYAPFTRQMKEFKGANPDIVSLTDTGATNDLMFVDVEEDSFTIDSTGSLVPELEDKYGKDAYGLSIDDTFGQDYINNSLRPQLFEQIGKILELEIK